MKILFAAGECRPFIKTGGLGDVMYELPRALAKKGHQVAVVLPLYLKVAEKYLNKMTKIGEINVQLAWRNQGGVIHKLVQDGVTYYFVENNYYFTQRDGIYGYDDDGERYGFFSKAVLETIAVAGFYPEIINCNDWHTALVPALYKIQYRYRHGYEKIGTVYTIHNIEYQGCCDKSFLDDVLGLSYEHIFGFEWNGQINFTKGAIFHADFVSTVSETYAKELEDDYFAHGLAPMIRAYSGKFRGITNSIDMDSWNPTTDRRIYRRFDHTNLQFKVDNKLGLQKELGLNVDPGVCLVTMVTRLASHKGIDNVLSIADEFMRGNVQLAVLGTGEDALEQGMRDLEARYPGRVRAVIAFDSDLAVKLYAAGDFFLMPSKSEPCGLAQMVAMRYGTIPIVRATGGLKDTVPPINPVTSEGRGITFATNNSSDLLDALWRAEDLYFNNNSLMHKIMSKDMCIDFSWDVAADKYLAMYKELI